MVGWGAGWGGRGEGWFKVGVQNCTTVAMVLNFENLG